MAINFKYTESTLINIQQYLSTSPNKIVLTGRTLTIPEIVTVSRKETKVLFTDDKKVLERVKKCYEHMMDDVKNGVPVYGCNTGYGAQASRVLIEGNKEEKVRLAQKVSEGITHVDVSVGPTFSKDVVRAAMLIRVNTLMQGVSAVKLEDLDKYRQLLNKNITPIVGQYGGIGASGDLAHNCRVMNVLRGYPGTKVIDKLGRESDAASSLKKHNIKFLRLDPKAGLGLVNGDNFSTALALLLAVDTLDLLLITSVLGAMVIEVLNGTNRSFHPLLANMRAHKGQKEVAELYRYLLSGSKLAYQEMDKHKRRPPGIKVQDAYSLRCISQYQGVNFEKIKRIFETITINANSVSDNPLWVTEDQVTENEKPWNWVSGGNFIAMHMVDVMDELRKIMTQTVKLNDRHLARMVNPNENNGLPANLSDPQAITRCAFKGVQIQSGMFDVYSTLLSMPVSTMFGVHEEANQDITSHALTSGILGLENLRIARYSTAQNLLAVAQAVDLRGGRKHLSRRTVPLYDFVRKHANYTKQEEPMNNNIESLYSSIINRDIMEYIQHNTFSR